MKMQIFETTLGGKKVTFETGRMAKQAGGSVVVRCGDTMVLSTACAAKDPKPGQGFFPLTCEFQEKTYAAGKIPGGFFKREGKLSEHEILTSRLVDRPLRPLFPEGFLNEVQVISTVISADKENSADTLALLGASAALTISDIPFQEPVAGVRLGRVNGQFVINPTPQVLDESSDMDILVAGTESSIIMVEGDANQVDEKTMLEGIFFAHKEIQNAIKLQKEMRAKCGKEKMEWTAPTAPQEILNFVDGMATEPMAAALKIQEKQKRYSTKHDVEHKAVEEAVKKFVTEGSDYAEADVKKVVMGRMEQIASKVMRAEIIQNKKRIDGRDLKTVRPISIEVGVLPRAHGSVLFTRGETQALVTCTLGAADDSQTIDALMGSREKHFLLHYNFPPFSVGETKPMRGPSRRDVGHGFLAERSLARQVPDKNAFPYTVRIVSDILESNGSSSMATVCGGSLALMDAGVPTGEPVAGIAMGLIAEGKQMEVLTDILGDEDHLGDMDFKVTGTKKGITGFQLDTKISGISMEVMEKALHQAKDARLFILGKMNEALSAPRKEMSRYAPKIRKLTVRQSKIKDVIGPGGKNIKGVIEATGVKVDINDDGVVNIFSTDPEMTTKAVEMIEALSGEVEIGRIYNGVVRKIVEFGAFVNIAPGTDGLVHISELEDGRVERVEDVLKEGEKCLVKVLEIDRQGRIRLSRRQAIQERGVA
ncbi:MAG: polyribonucleotide nucleotidyltransferase [Deltaproteobacteria bacterium]|nr:polyribonucleotide nucleotidyltransferase [Deltaproteobacteria bacterium]